MTQIKERPILFNGDMVRAILSGTKTQTRRIIFPQPFAGEYFQGDVFFDGFDPIVSTGEPEPAQFSAEAVGGGASLIQKIVCKWGYPGDSLYVRETWAPHADFPTTRAVYRADPECKYDADRWYPSIHMPRWASRINLGIIGLRVERLQDISESDAKAEGAQALQWYDQTDIADLIDLPLKESANPYRNGFALLWDSIYHKQGRGWASNPWVWVPEFKMVSP